MTSITAYWISSEYTIKTMLMAIREIHGSHTGKNIAETVYLVAVEFGIVEKLGYFMMDRAGNNGHAVEELDSQIREAGGKGFEPKERRLRCFGHIQNRVVRKLLFGKKASDIETKFKELEIQCEEEEPTETANTGDMEIEILAIEVMEEKKNEKKQALEEDICERWRALGAVGNYITL